MGEWTHERFEQEVEDLAHYFIERQIGLEFMVAILSILVKRTATLANASEDELNRYISMFVRAVGRVGTGRTQ